MFLLDDFVMTTEQWINLIFLVRLGKSHSEALCMFQQAYKEQTLSCSTVFIWCKGFKKGCANVEDDPSCGTTLAPSLHKLCTFSELL